MALVYSCCFWFSLRLGGILIGLFSTLQATTFLIACCLAYTHSDTVKERLSELNDHSYLIYSKDFMRGVFEDPRKYILIAIVSTCIYLITCMFFIYGAYILNIMMMLSYIILELFRLIIISFTVATGLLLIKQSTMDIGSLIGASVVGGFFLLGMFYLWVCVANLPILINEMERDDQAATIAKLQQLLETSQKPRRPFDSVGYDLANGPSLPRDVFVVSHRDHLLQNNLIYRSRIPVPN